MTNTTVYLAERAEDYDAARALCREWLDWHWRHYPEGWPRGDDHPMAPKQFEAGLKGLETGYRPPQGRVLIGAVDGVPASCVMYHDAGEGRAEFNRMFVSETGRGHGLGRLMLERMFEQMIADGYRKVFFSSAVFLTHARTMYEAAGFVPMPHPEDLPEEWRERLYFMERALV